MDSKNNPEMAFKSLSEMKTIGEMYRRRASFAIREMNESAFRRDSESERRYNINILNVEAVIIRPEGAWVGMQLWVPVDEIPKRESEFVVEYDERKRVSFLATSREDAERKFNQELPNQVFIRAYECEDEY